MVNNLLKLNSDKTEFILFYPYRRSAEDYEYNLKIGNDIISARQRVRNLGVYFDKHLSMEYQVHHIKKVCRMQIRKISHIRQYLSQEACNILVVCMVTSRLDYGNALLYGINKKLIAELQKVQNTAARLTIRSKKLVHISPILKSLHWLPVEYRLQYKILLHTYRCLNETAPIYLQELIHQYYPRRSLRSQFSRLINVPKVQGSTYGSRTFQSSSSSLWNALPLDLKISPSLDDFKSNLKTLLFNRAFNHDSI